MNTIVIFINLFFMIQKSLLDLGVSIMVINDYNFKSKDFFVCFVKLRFLNLSIMADLLLQQAGSLIVLLGL